MGEDDEGAVGEEEEGYVGYAEVGAGVETGMFFLRLGVVVFWG